MFINIAYSCQIAWLTKSKYFTNNDDYNGWHVDLCLSRHTSQVLV